MQTLQVVPEERLSRIKVSNQLSENRYGEYLMFIWE